MWALPPEWFMAMMIAIIAELGFLIVLAIIGIETIRGAILRPKEEEASISPEPGVN